MHQQLRGQEGSAAGPAAVLLLHGEEAGDAGRVRGPDAGKSEAHLLRHRRERRRHGQSAPDRASAGAEHGDPVPHRSGGSDAGGDPPGVQGEVLPLRRGRRSGSGRYAGGEEGGRL